jgi:hypothetical protein
VGVLVPVLIGCGGFLLAVLWMDLMFDVQVLAHRGRGTLPEPVLASIGDYYHRATTTARPMSHLIGLVMAIMLSALGFRAALGDDPAWWLPVAAILAAGPVLLALVRTVPNAVRLGRRTDTAEEQTRLARVGARRPRRVPGLPLRVPGGVADRRLTSGRASP